MNKCIVAICATGLLTSYFLNEKNKKLILYTNRISQIHDKPLSGVYIRKVQYFPSPLFHYFKWILPSQYSLRIVSENKTRDVYVHFNPQSYNDYYKKSRGKIYTNNIVGWMRNNMNNIYTSILEKNVVHTKEEIIPIEYWYEYYEQYYELPYINITRLKIFTYDQDIKITYFGKLFTITESEDRKYKFDPKQEEALLKLIYYSK